MLHVSSLTRKSQTMARYIVTLNDGWKMAIAAPTEQAARVSAIRYDSKCVGVKSVEAEVKVAASPLGNPRTFGVYDRK